jgi:hypothetical protein
MAKIYSAPAHIKKPGDCRHEENFSWREYSEKIQELEDTYTQELRDFLKSRKPNGKSVGEIVYFPVCDGHAQYMVASMRPLELVHMALGDCYEFRYANRLTAKDINDQINHHRMLENMK